MRLFSTLKNHFSKRPNVSSPPDRKFTISWGAYSVRIICIRHRWEGEMGSSQHKSPHEARAFRRGLYMVTSAEISPSAVRNAAVCIFSYEYISETAKSNWTVKRIGERAGWTDLTIRLVVKVNNMSERNGHISHSRCLKSRSFTSPFCSFVLLYFRSFASPFVVSHRPFVVSHRPFVVSKSRTLALSLFRIALSQIHIALSLFRCFAVSLFRSVVVSHFFVSQIRTFVVSYFCFFVLSLFRTFFVSYFRCFALSLFHTQMWRLTLPSVTPGFNV